MLAMKIIVIDLLCWYRSRPFCRMIIYHSHTAKPAVDMKTT